MGTPHISCEKGDFAKTVLMPGDPLRAKFIAENFLASARCVNEIRGINGYTGMYNGVRVSVMASGMGMPSMGIYSYELYKFYDVENIIRVGTAGAIDKSLRLRDVVAGMGACTNSSCAKQYNLPGDFAPICSFPLLNLANINAKELAIDLKIGNIYSSDNLYNDSRKSTEWEKMGVLAVEMEAAALYMNAARLGRNALALCTISDLMFEPFDSCSAIERQESFTQMMELALSVAVSVE
jgi:purine-nucleoside phosphorylase